MSDILFKYKPLEGMDVEKYIAGLKARLRVLQAKRLLENARKIKHLNLDCTIECQRQ